MAATYQTIATTDWVTDDITINKPTGTVDGDLMVAILCTEGDPTNDCTAPEGWDVVLTETGGTYTRGMKAFSRVASSEGANYVFAYTAHRITGVIIRISDYATTTPIYAKATSTVTLGTTPVFASSAITPNVSDSLLIMAVFVDSDNGAPDNIGSYAIETSNPSWTERFQSSKGTYGMFAVATASRPEITATGAVQFTHDGGNGDDSGCMLLAVKRVVAFTNTTLDTATISDSGVYGYGITKLDTVTSTDSNSAIMDEWVESSKNSSSWTDTSKNASSWTDESKNSSSWTNTSK
jgi:hypothetical protein